MDIKNVDFAALSPSMSKARFADNLQGRLINLAKKQMNMQSEMLTELMEQSPVASNADGNSIIDLKL